MDNNQNPFMSLPGITAQELGLLNQSTAELTENQKRYFFYAYSGKRKSEQDLLIFCIIGLFVPGLQRFIVGQIGMGILYLFTGGLCFIGSVVDLVNHKTLADEYNRKMAFESFQIAKMSA